MLLVWLLVAVAAPEAATRRELAGATGWHTIAVRLKQARGDVLARPGYWRYAAP